ncbi:hypothetical protein ILYODFUR_015936 [Ilyodon furcidens]|uniref:Uncharacterized protein n=1 Tax=Ilyodon furcidens TaxID=33524 RepID=A0ABV0VEN6_9TELE
MVNVTIRRNIVEKMFLPGCSFKSDTTCSCGVSGAHDGCTINPAEKCCNVTSSNNTGMRRMKYPERLLQTSGVRFCQKTPVVGKLFTLTVVSYVLLLLG